MPIFNPELETLPRDKLRHLQTDRLKHLVAYVDRQLPFYHDAFAQAGVRPDDIQSVDDIGRLPFTRKSDLRDHYPFGMLAVPQEELRRVHASSGTTGRPTVVCYTRHDLGLFSEVVARSLAAGGAEPGMMLHNAYGYGLFTGGLGLHGGAELLGLNVVPVSGGGTERQVVLITDFKPDLIACTPSYAQTLAGVLARNGVEPKEISLRFAILGAEPWTDTIRQDVDRGLGVRATNIYGLSEIIGPGVSQECVEERNGAHLWEDHFLAEVIDPESGEPLPDGVEGELVITTLTKEAMPLIRYRTGDRCSLSHEPCACGRTHVRMSMIQGRTDDMLIIRGINVFPTQIEAAMQGIEGIAPHYQLVVTRDRTLDEAELRVEVDESLFNAIGTEVLAGGALPVGQQLEGLRNAIDRRMRDMLGVRLTITLVAPGATPRSEGGKLRRVSDQRHI